MTTVSNNSNNFWAVLHDFAAGDPTLPGIF